MATETKTRKDRLQRLTDDFHTSKYGDYDTTYEEFASTYGLDWGDDPTQGIENDPPVEPIPKYASLHSDETYGMVHVFDSLKDALADQVPDGSDTLSVPNGVMDLDTGKFIDYSMVAIPKDMYGSLIEAVERGIEYHELAIAGQDPHDEDDIMQQRIVDRFRRVRDML